MDILKKLNEAIHYIEEHLTDEIDPQELVKIFCFSEHHYKRMFSFITGLTIADYVRKRRLTLAAFDLIETDMRVLDVAIKYGYGSADSFSRAFQSLHNVPPSKVRENTVPLKAYPRMTFQISIKGDVEMDYKIIKKGSFTVVGKREYVADSGGAFEPNLWESLEQIELELKKLTPTAFPGILHVSISLENGGTDYYIAAATSDPCPEGMSELRIPAQTWAVFSVTGPLPEALLETWEKVYTDWFPTSDYELANAPEMIDSEQTEIWIPIKKN
ncbi:AraC family transcriptional regulator [Alkalihalobacillus trypoxylicola]|uniref:AraC family transcriptional regulator n=1 Tax=Alkalihalobacillus trypoxylicola TaxID=519424 RepID=A0A162DF99_9BACI|nr:AraC family transcriptional regulator [Alkalihalobacillus trypoxylicola]KYG29450.1 AraC family transcriptional regulator [Alkalihalobacillus trypoxylicola]